MRGSHIDKAEDCILLRIRRWRITMKGVTQYIYRQNGTAVGCIRGKYIHAMSGQAVGQLNGTHVHKLSGPYVGELDHDMIVDKHLGNLGNIGNPGNPGNAGNPGNPGNRGSMNFGYRDKSNELFD